MDKQALLPCPFCGDEYDKGEMQMFAPQTGAKWKKVTCRICGASAPDTVWNTRSVPGTVSEQNAAQGIEVSERGPALATAPSSPAAATPCPDVPAEARELADRYKAALRFVRFHLVHNPRVRESLISHIDAALKERA